MGVYAAMSVVGGAFGLLAGGLLVSYTSWRWVLFVNVPIGIAAAIAAVMVLPRGDAPGRPVRPARRRHGDGRRGRARLRPRQRRHRPGRHLALG